MANLFEYLHWRDDLLFDQAPLNEVDAMILSRICYLPFSLLGPLEEPLPLTQAASRLLELPEMTQALILKADLRLLEALAASYRFGSCRMVNYRDVQEEATQTQFFAMTVELTKDLQGVLFRGTDNNMFGWKENFNMAFQCPIPAQALAAEYLEEALSAFPGQVIPCGHSKGGNLTIYAAACCTRPERLGDVYSFDGPGFDEAFLASPGFTRILPKIRSYVPQFSVVGMLLGHQEQHTVVHSTQPIHIMQHDTFSWQIDGPRFRYAEGLSQGSRFLDGTIRSWIAGLSYPQREQFVDALYEVLSQARLTDVRQFQKNQLATVWALVGAYRSLDEETRKLLTRVVSLFFASTKSELTEAMRSKKKKEESHHDLS